MAEEEHDKKFHFERECILQRFIPIDIINELINEAFLMSMFISLNKKKWLCAGAAF